MDHLEHLRQQKHKPMLNIHERPSSIVRAQFASKRDASFSSYLQPGHLHKQEAQQKTEECDQISIFDAAEYFRSEQKEQMQAGSPRVFDLSSMGRLSSVSSVDNGNYRTRSFHATPTSSSEASWSSQTGLLQPSQSGSMGITIIKNPSPSPTTTNTPTTSTKWGKISSKWLISGRKCPCSGKKSVQVEERIEAKTPRMVDLGRCSSSNGTSYPPSLYSIRQTSPKILPSNGNFGLSPIPKKFDYNSGAASTISGSTATTIAAANHPVGSYPCSMNNVMNTPNGFSNHPKVMSISATNTASPTVVAANTPTVTNGFTFPVLENPPVGVKKMFNVIAPNHPVDDPHRDSLEVFQPRSLPRSRRASYEEDTALSDGSSDLFELESFSTSNFNPSMMSVNHHHHHHHHHSSFKRFGSSVCRHSLDEETEVESVAPTECYAPSEVSVDWSVTTAEGFERSSLANFSEVGYGAMRREMDNNTNTNSGNDEKMMRNNKGGGGGLLMSCRCEKAVSVGPGPVNRNMGRNQHVGGRPKEDGSTATANHVIISSSSIAGAGNNNVVGGGVGVMVGRSRPNLMPMPFAA